MTVTGIYYTCTSLRKYLLKQFPVVISPRICWKTYLSFFFVCFKPNKETSTKYLLPPFTVSHLLYSSKDKYLFNNLKCNALYWNTCMLSIWTLQKKKKHKSKLTKWMRVRQPTDSQPLYNFIMSCMWWTCRHFRKIFKVYI